MKTWVDYLLKNIPGDLHKKLKSHVNENKTTIRQFILDAIKEKLNGTDSDK